MTNSKTGAKNGKSGTATSRRKSSGPDDAQQPHPRGLLAPSRAVNGAALPMLRTSERGTMKRCEFLWELTYNQHRKPLTEAPALRFGSLVHAALADYYIPGVKRGAHPAKAFKKHYDADLKRNSELFGMKLEENERWVNAEELGIAMLTHYVDVYGSDSDWEVLVTEQPFQVIVPYPDDVYAEFSPDGESHKRGTPWFRYTGVLDGVWKNRKSKEIWVPDHKSAQGIYKKLGYLQMDDQAGAYWSFGVTWLVQNQFLKVNQHLNGMLYNFLRKALPDERPSQVINGVITYLNKDGSVSKSQPAPYFLRQPIFRDEYDRSMAVKRAMADFRRTELLRAGKLEVGKTPGQFTCPGCPMGDACELHETGHDWQTFLHQTTQTWDPYAEHEVYDGR